MSSEAAIRIEDLGKLYRLGARLESFPTLRDQIARAVSSPFRRLRSALRGESARLADEELWALRNLSVTIEPGEVVGVVGRNGAGKTTLLKILSRITEPTEGRAVIRGRVGSLLEVGTGFHPELTGRENIFLNGAILGMRRAEIGAKLEEIVAFAEIDRFLDTQVKHYSSGMYLRLAFAVAAHLEPEILLVDEVLAVGDSAFQRKCLGKMSNVAQQGRTILFVSHNMEAIQRLCDRCLWIDRGRVAQDGETEEVVRAYLAAGAERIRTRYRADVAPSSEEPAVLRDAAVLGHGGEVIEGVRFGESFSFRMQWSLARQLPGVAFFVQVRDDRERLVFAANTLASPVDAGTGESEIVCTVEENVLLPGDYAVTVGCFRPPRTFLHRVEGCLRLRILDTPAPGRSLPYRHREAIVAPNTRWQLLLGTALETETP